MRIALLVLTIALLSGMNGALAPAQSIYPVEPGDHRSGGGVQWTNGKTPPSVIYRSMDGGRNWVSFDNGIPNDATVSSFLVAGKRILASTERHGIFAIQDGETLWKRIDQNLPDGIDINAIASIGNSLVIATFSHGILVSTNNGSDWHRPLMKSKNVPFRCLFAKGSLLFAGADDGIYLSSDQGYTWKLVYEGVQANGFAERDGRLYAALMNGAIATADNGATWNYVYKPLTLHDISSDGENIYAMTLGGGLLKSRSHGGTWEDIQSGLGATNLYTFEVKGFGNRLFAAQWYGIYVSDDEGASWRMIRNGLPDSTAFTTMEITGDGLIAGAVASRTRGKK